LYKYINFYTVQKYFDTKIIICRKTIMVLKNYLSKVSPHANLKSKKVLEKTFRPVFLSEKVLNKI
jgi:hypothetical protein